MAFQLPQRDFGGASNKGSVTGAYVPEQEQGAMGGLLNTLTKVSSQYVQKQTNKEIAKKQMEGQQAIAQGKSLNDIKDGDSWVNYIFGDSATLEGARSAQAEASFLNGYSDLIGQMDELKSMPPEEFNNYITQHYSKYLTGDAQVDSAVMSNTSKIRQGLMKTHTGEHTAWVQEENIKAITDLTRAKVEASTNAIASVAAFEDRDQVEMQRDLEVKELSDYLTSVASKGKAEQNNIAQQVILDLQNGQDLSYEATKEYSFSNEEMSKINSAKRALDKARKSKLTAQQQEQRAADEAVVADMLKNPGSFDINKYAEHVKAVSKKWDLSDDKTVSMHKAGDMIALKQQRWGNAVVTGDRTGNIIFDPSEADDAHAFTYNKIDEAASTPEQAAATKVRFRNSATVSKKYSKAMTDGLKILAKGDVPSEQAVSTYNQLHQHTVAAQGDNKFALRQIKSDSEKATYLAITSKLESNPDMPVKDAIMEVHLEREARKGQKTVPLLAEAYRKDTGNYNDDVSEVVDTFCDGAKDSPCATHYTGILREEMNNIARNNPESITSVSDIRTIALNRMSDNRYGNVQGLTEEIIASDPNLRNVDGGMFKTYTPEDQVKHYFSELNPDAPITSDMKMMYNKQTGNLIIETLNEDGTRGGIKTVRMSDVSKAWENSPASKKVKMDQAEKLEELNESKGFKKPGTVDYYSGVAGALGNRGAKGGTPLTEKIDNVLQSEHVQFAIDKSLYIRAIKAVQGFIESPFATPEELGVKKDANE